MNRAPLNRVPLNVNRLPLGRFPRHCDGYARWTGNGLKPAMV